MARFMSFMGDVDIKTCNINWICPVFPVYLLVLFKFGFPSNNLTNTGSLWHH